jgi:hypothetical protein
MEKSGRPQGKQPPAAQASYRSVFLAPAANPQPVGAQHQSSNRTDWVWRSWWAVPAPQSTGPFTQNSPRGWHSELT